MHWIESGSVPDRLVPLDKRPFTSAIYSNYPFNSHSTDNTKDIQREWRITSTALDYEGLLTHIDPA